MPKKRYMPPQALLQRVIAGLEEDYRPKYRGAVLALLSEGPLLCSDALRQEIEQPDPDLITWRAELLQLVRTLVRVEGLDSSLAEIGTYGNFTFTGHHAGGRVDIAAGGRNVRDVVVLQLVLLLQLVGLENVRACRAGDCRRIFVKLWRREYCSARCQKRAYMRQRRENERAKRTRRRRGHR